MKAMAKGPRPVLFALRRRTLGEKLIDQGFHNLAVLLASVVGLVLAGILFTVVGGARDAVGQFGLSFLSTSNWDPVGGYYGAFTAIYGTLVSSLFALLIAVPLGVGTAICGGSAIAAVHVGVEFRWWPSPMPECAAPKFGGGSIADRLASMPLRPATS